MTGDNWLDAQYSVLGAGLISPECIPRILRDTRETDYAGPCRTVYKAMEALFLAGTPVDPVSLASKLGGGYREFLAQLMVITPTAANLDSYIRITREQAKLCALRELGKQLAEAESPEQASALLTAANGAAVNRAAVKITTMHDALRSFFERKTRQAVYLSWPVRELDDRLFAEPGDFIIIGGRPSSGKSAWALQCAWHWAQKYRVGFFSLETSDDKLFDRQMSALTGIAMADIKRSKISDDDWTRIAEMSEAISTRPLELVPAAAMSAADIRAVTMMQGYQIIIIDYLQLIQAKGDNRVQQVTDISIALHTMAQSLGITVVALSQLSRLDPKAGKQVPDLSSLRESGQIEQDADIVMMLNIAKDSDDRELWIRKNKEGTCPQIRLAFDGAHQTFSKASSQEGKAEMDKLRAAGKKHRSTPVIGQPEEEGFEQLPMDTPIPF